LLTWVYSRGKQAAGQGGDSCCSRGCIPGESMQLAGEVEAGRQTLAHRPIELQASMQTIQQLQAACKMMQGKTRNVQISI